VGRRLQFGQAREHVVEVPHMVQRIAAVHEERRGPQRGVGGERGMVTAAAGH